MSRVSRRQFVVNAVVPGTVLAAGAVVSGMLGRRGDAQGRAQGRPARPLSPPDGEIATAFLIGPGFNVIDTMGPWEVFQDVMVQRARSGAPAASHDHPFSLFTVSDTGAPVTGTGGLTVVPGHTFASAPAPRVIVVPAQRASDAALEWLRAAARGADVVMSVCTGAFVLGKAGLLDGLAATTHHEYYDAFAARFPGVELRRGLRYVEHDKISTAGGLTSGIDLALRVVERYFGADASAATAAYMEYEGTARRA